MRLSPTPLVALSITVALVAAACSPDNAESADSSLTESSVADTDLDAADSETADQDSPDQGSDGDETADEADQTDSSAQIDGDGTAGYDLDAIVGKIGDGYARITDDWPGFDPVEHPAILAIKTNSGELAGALALNFPDPDALGDARQLDDQGTPIGSVYHITNPTDAAQLANLSGFDFHMKIGGTDAYAMEAGGTDGFFDPTTNDYIGTLLHEMFHRWQDEAFDGDLGSQDVEGYAYTAENLSLAALEDRALIEAADADTTEAKEEAAKRFAAIRLARMAADDRVAALDNSQERFEGTARYIEHRLAGTDESYANYNETDYSVELASDPTATGGVKDHYGFGRFYATGASVLGLLDALGAEGVNDKIEAGSNPAEVLIDFLGVTDADVADLVAEAKATYDPLGELDDLAAEAAEQAKDEPPVFGEDTFGGSDDGDVPDGEGIEITDAEIECFEDRGVDLLGGGQPSQEDFEACLSS